MLNLKVLLQKLTELAYVPVQQGSSVTMTVTKGTLTASKYVKYGHVMQMVLNIKNSSSISAGSDIFEAKLDTAFYPSNGGLVCGCGYYGARAILWHIISDGRIVVRNAGGSSLSANSVCTIYCTYMV